MPSLTGALATKVVGVAGGCHRVVDIFQHLHLPVLNLSHGASCRRMTYQLSAGFVLPLKERSGSSLFSCGRILSKNGTSVHEETASRTTIVNQSEERTLRKSEILGAFQKLPMVMPSLDILSSAQRKARNVSPTKDISNIVKREKNKGAKQLDTFMKELAVPLRLYRENFPKKQILHPYERSLVELTFGEGMYDEPTG